MKKCRKYIIKLLIIISKLKQEIYMNNTELTDHTIELNGLKISNKYPLTLISGPCQLESLEHAMMIAEKLIEICDRNAINFVFKSSFD